MLLASLFKSAMKLKNLLDFVLFAFVVSNIITTLAQLQLLPQAEVEALQSIFKKLHYKHTNVNRSFCNDSGRNFVIARKPVDILTDITCSCSGTVCHVTNIRIKGQNLWGTLPAEFANLSQLTEIELTRNYISGEIPLSFTKLPLTILSLSSNPISGLIPKEIGDIATLEQMILEGTQLGGPLPSNLGSLNSLQRLLLSSNNFTGTIPDTFGKLKSLTDFRIDGNGLHGKIPGLIGYWTKIKIVNMQGTSMEGPIPESVSQLKDITELRISDLSGSATTLFPNLREAINLETLVLRNCKIAAPIMDYISEWPSLKLLDLSFNMLTGQLPVSLPNKNLTYMFLNNNLLNGTLPNWVSNINYNVDISYNNFTTDPSSITCKEKKLNAVSSAASNQNSKSKWCMIKDLPCSTTPTHSSLFINCGGEVVPFEGHKYEDDSSPGGPSYFYASSQKWAYSSSGDFMSTSSDAYTASNKNIFSLNITNQNNNSVSNYYQTARVAPSSLNYYGLCLREGGYKVRLHFAEIMFSNDQSFSSLGNRIFNVSIQGKSVLENFNIAKEAGGVGRAIYRDFETNVSGSTLEIHLYWAGKGTTSVPQKGVYGPLISATQSTILIKDYLLVLLLA